MIKIACEAPLSIMEEVRSSTDYCYALVHLFEQYPEYYNFFVESLSRGRRVILDNSIFELGTAFDSDIFASWIIELKPTEYIIPDVLENSIETTKNIVLWVEKYSNLPGKRIGVVQGKTYSDLKSCYLTVNKFCDKIAISFDYSYYEKIYPHKNKFISWMNGRVLFINQLLEDGILNTSKPHHLLGISLPQEALFYRHEDYSFIETWDTSNPVVHAALGIPYKSWGLEEKQKMKVIDLFHLESEKIDHTILHHNIHTFKRFLK